MELELEKYSYERRKPTTINQCINDLVNGYADANVHMELEKNLFELLFRLLQLIIISKYVILFV